MEITVAETYTYDRLSCNLYDWLCRISTKNTLCACIQEGPGTVLSLMVFDSSDEAIISILSNGFDKP